MSKNQGPTPQDDSNLTEDVLRDAGKSDREVESTGQISRADDGTELLFGERGATVNSPIHRAVWGYANPRHFAPKAAPKDAVVDAAVDACIAVVARHRAAGSLFDADQKISETVLQELGEAGFWGMRIDPKFGGKGASVRSFMRMITQTAATGDPTTAGLASIHGCIGAVDPLMKFGTDEQKARLLPKLASGEALSAFALTEPGAGSDMTQLKTTAVLDGDSYVINGKKLFISNAIPGRTIGLVAMLNGKPAVFIVDLPKEENEHFRTEMYGLHALTHTYNNGLVFTNFRVPKDNHLAAPKDNGLIIAYHGLNYGRVALCANSAGVMRLLLRSISPNSWAAFRQTYGASIDKRELVQRRMARMAALIVGADALAGWCATLLDEGYRGELECIIAKIFGSEAQKEAAIELALKTHGGRAFLKGHIIGDNLHDYLAPCIYEGEGEMLAMKFFQSLATEHGTLYMKPVGDAMKSIVKEGHYLTGPVKFLWNGFRYSMWYAKQKLRSIGRNLRLSGGSIGATDKRLNDHAAFAHRQFAKLPLELTGAMLKHQIKLGDRQCRIVHMSMRVQETVTILVTAAYGAQSTSPATKLAADILCQDLRRKLTGEQPSDAYFKACSKLADMIVAGEFTELNGVPETTVLQRYS